DGEPLAVMRNAIPERIAPSREALADSGLYACLRERGVTTVLAHERIGATVADAEHAELLGEEVGAALLTMERKSFANDGSVVEYVYHVYRASRYSFEVTLVDSCAERREAWAGERVLATTARGQRAEARVTATLLCTSQPSPVLTCTKHRLRGPVTQERTRRLAVPPSTVSSTPVVERLRGEAREQCASASSAGAPSRPCAS